MEEVCQSWDGWDCRRLPAQRASVLRLDGLPPRDWVPAAPQTGRVEVLFCGQGGLQLELTPVRRLELRSGQVLCLPGRAGACRCRFVPEPFRGILVSERDERLRAELAALCPGLDAAPPERRHGCGVVTAALWSEALFHTLDQLPAQLQGDYCALKMTELLYLLHAGLPFTARGGGGDYFDPHQLQAVERLHDYLMEHLDEHLTIPQLAERFRISGTMLKNCFRQRYGAPVHQYLMERRMARAAELLSGTDQTVIQVAAAVGYSSASQFSVAFQSRFRLTPGQYRRMARQPPREAQASFDGAGTAP